MNEVTTYAKLTVNDIKEIDCAESYTRSIHLDNDSLTSLSLFAKHY